MSVLKRLWNGGLDSAGADPRKLAERRIISVGSFALIPSALILIVSNIFILGGNYTRVIVISMVMVVAILGLYLQAYRGWQRFAAISFISALWAAPVALMFDEGFSSSNWAWLLPVILLANFILSRRAAIVFTVLSVLVLIAFAVLTLQGQLGQPIDTNEHAITVAISGSIIFTLACMLGYYYRTSQMKSEEVLLDNMRTLQEEVEIRREAEEKALTAERAKTTFLTTVSHELRTPLNGVIGASQLLAGRKLGEEEGELVDIINSSAENTAGDY